ncbi:MAG TPA: PEP-CTERM sorting domain-containing protein, partial [Kamptonema sp.]|nr:PEP-CTERM sorting domain-containing protein [Kamptonema sp.]
GVSSTGVFSNVTAKSVAKENSGFTNFNQYQSWVNNNAPNTNTGTKGGEIGYGGVTVEEAKNYLTSETTMKTVTKTIEVPVVKTVTKTVREQVTTIVNETKRVKINGQWVNQIVPKEVKTWVNKKVTEQITVMEKKKVTEQVPVTAINDSSYGQLNAIKTGTKVGDISFLGADEIASLSNGFKGLGGVGKYTVGFSFSQTLLGKFMQPGNAVITLMEECTNDNMILKATLPSIPDSEPVPEPITILGMALGGLGLVKGKMNQRRAARANVIG